MPASRNSTTAQRLGRLEAEVEGLRGSIQDVASAVRSLANDVKDSSRTQWSPIIAAASLAVAILGGLITLGAQGPLRELDRHAEALAAIDARQDSMASSRFTEADGQSLRNDFRGVIRDMDAALQREMRDLDRVAESRLDHLDTILQREMDLKIKPVQARVAVLEQNVGARHGGRWNRDQQEAWVRDTYHRDIDQIHQEMDRLYDRIHEHQKDGHPNRVIERVQGIRDRVDRIEGEQARRSDKVYGGK